MKLNSRHQQHKATVGYICMPGMCTGAYFSIPMYSQLHSIYNTLCILQMYDNSCNIYTPEIHYNVVFGAHQESICNDMLW